MNILGYMQQVGRALMVPVAVLPAAAILMGVGYWIDYLTIHYTNGREPVN